MTDINETQWWKQYLPGYEEQIDGILYRTDDKGTGNTIDGKLKQALHGTELLENWNASNEYKKKNKLEVSLSDVWQDKNPESRNYARKCYEIGKALKPYHPASVINDALNYLNANYYPHSRYTGAGDILNPALKNKNIKDCSFKILMETQMNFGRFENIVLAHEDCTEKDLIEVAKHSAELKFETVVDDGEAPLAEPIDKVGELNMWGKIFMDPRASDELKQAIVEHSERVGKHRDWYDIKNKDTYGSERKPSVIDYYLERDDCPKEFFLPAVNETMDYFYHDYTREKDYYVDAEKLAKIVSHPNMTEEAFKEALDIVAERMCSPADEVDPDNLPYHYQGQDDTCNLMSDDKEKIMQNILKNPACTPEIMEDVFQAAKEVGLLGEIKKSKNQYPIDQEKWDLAELLFERQELAKEQYSNLNMKDIEYKSESEIFYLKEKEECGDSKKIAKDVEAAFARVEAKKQQMANQQKQTTSQEIAEYEKSRENRPQTTLDKVVEAKIKDSKNMISN